MDTSENSFNHAIAALATPFAKSAIAIIRISGYNCINMVCTILQSPKQSSLKKPKLLCLKPRHVTLCNIINPKTNKILDSCLVTSFPAPHSYTGEDCAEISIHGSTIGIEKILSVLYKIGFQSAQPGEFTKRAFINRKLDLTQAEAIHTIIESHTDAEHNHAVAHLSGALTKHINTIKTYVTHIAAQCAVSLDYPSDEIQESTHIKNKDIDKILLSLDTLIQSYSFRKIQTSGVKIVIAGKTNAGKSSLFNCLLKQDRAIVNKEHGTTRDFIEHSSTLNDIPIRLFDTAGLRKSKNKIEQQGINLSHSLISSADILLFVVDSALGWTTTHDILFKNIFSNDKNCITITTPTIIVWNKTDLKTSKDYKTQVPKSIRALAPVVTTDTKNYKTISALQKKIYKTILKGIHIPQQNDIIINSSRQHQCLSNCYNAIQHVQQALQDNIPLDMISLDVDIALKELGSITGEVNTEDILDMVFGNFCVGK